MIKYVMLACTAVAMLGCASSQVQRERAITKLNDDRSRLLAAPLSSSPGFSDPVADRGDLPQRLKEFYLGPDAAVTEIRGERAWYIRFRLPDFAEAYHIEFLTQGELIAANAFAQSATGARIVPGVTLLDSSYRIIGSYAPQFELIQDRYATRAGDYAYLSICNAEPRYLVVHGIPETYRSLSGRTVMNYTQYGSYHSQIQTVASSEGSLALGLPERAVGKTFWGGVEEQPCTRPNRGLDEFLKIIEQAKSWAE